MWKKPRTRTSTIGSDRETFSNPTNPTTIHKSRTTTTITEIVNKKKKERKKENTEELLRLGNENGDGVLGEWLNHYFFCKLLRQNIFHNFFLFCWCCCLFTLLSGVYFAQASSGTVVALLPPLSHYFCSHIYVHVVRCMYLIVNVYCVAPPRVRCPLSQPQPPAFHRTLSLSLSF